MIIIKIIGIVLVLSVFLTSQCVYGQFGNLGSTITNVVTSGVNTGKAFGSKIPEIIPSPADIFALGKETLLGLPFKSLAKAINQFCSVALSADGIKPKITPNVSAMNFVFFTDTGNITFPLEESEKLWSHPEFKKSWNTTLFITGWMTDLSKPNTAIDVVAGAYKLRGNHNFIVFDSAKFVDTLYTWSALNTQDLGTSVGLALAKLVTAIPLSNIHVIGM